MMMASGLPESPTKDRVQDYEKSMAAQRKVSQSPFAMPGQQQTQATAQRQQAQNAPQRMAERTFAQLQQQGMARPAPPPAAPAPQMMQAVQQRLAQQPQQTARGVEPEEELRRRLMEQMQIAKRGAPDTSNFDPNAPPNYHYENAAASEWQAQRAGQQPGQTMEMTRATNQPMPVLTAGGAITGTQPQTLEMVQRQLQGNMPVLTAAPPQTQAVPMGPGGMPVLTAGQPAQPVPAAQPAAPTPPAPTAGQPPLLQQVQQALPQTPAAAPQAAPAAQPAPMAGQPPQGAPAAPQAPMTQQQMQGGLREQLMQQLSQLQQQPGVYGTEQIQQMREAQRADIEAQFGAQRQQLEEEMARRGLSASSIAAGQFGDVAGQQARAIATMEAGLTEKAAESIERGRSQLMQGLTQGLGLDLQSRGLDIEDKKVQADIDSEAKRLMQQDRSLDLQQARDIAQQNISYAQLAEQAKDRVSRENISMAQLQEQSSQFAQRLGLDRDQFNADVEARQRELQQRDRSITLEESRFMAQTELERDRLNQSAYEFAQRNDLDIARFESDERYRAIVIETMLAQYAMPQEQQTGGTLPTVRPGESGNTGRGTPGAEPNPTLDALRPQLDPYLEYR